MRRSYLLNKEALVRSGYEDHINFTYIRGHASRLLLDNQDLSIQLIQPLLFTFPLNTIGEHQLLRGGEPERHFA